MPIPSPGRPRGTASPPASRAGRTAYPEIHHVTAPIRAAARAIGDGEGFNLWAGQSYALARERPAAEIAEELALGLARSR